MLISSNEGFCQSIAVFPSRACGEATSAASALSKRSAGSEEKESPDLDALAGRGVRGGRRVVEGAVRAEPRGAVLQRVVGLDENRLVRAQARVEVPAVRGVPA